MGEGFVVLQSNMVDIYHYHDEPGTVTIISHSFKLLTHYGIL